MTKSCNESSLKAGLCRFLVKISAKLFFGYRVQSHYHRKRKISPELGLTLDLGFKSGFFLKHLFSSWPERLQKLHWDTLQVACSCPLLPQPLHFPRSFQVYARNFFAVVALDNKATLSLLAVAVCRLRDISTFLLLFSLPQKPPYLSKNRAQF